jgi:hypothetical protein
LRLSREMGIPINELQERISSAEFGEYMLSMKHEPDCGTRLDYLMSMVCQMLARVEGTLGGKPPKLTSPIIEWGKSHIEIEKERQEQVLEMFKALGKQNG